MEPVTVTLTHVGYPHEAGYLFDCPACEFGPCVCDPATDAPCVSTHCEHPENAA